MSTTSNRAYRYAASTDHTRLWEHLQNLATDVDVDVQALYVHHFCSLQSLAGANITSGTAFGDVTLGTVVEDTASMTSGSTIVIKKAGRYDIKGIAGFSSNATGFRGVAVVLNGTIIRATIVPGVATAGIYIECSTKIRLAVNDILKLQVVQNSGSTLTGATDRGGMALMAEWTAA